jgi:hypothetical protein
MQRGLATILAVAALGTASVFLLLRLDGRRGTGVLRAAAPAAGLAAEEPARAAGAPRAVGEDGATRARDAVAVAALPSTTSAADLVAAEPPPENGLEILVRWRADKAVAAGARLSFLEWETLDRVVGSEYGGGRRWEAVERFGRTFAADAAGLALVPRPRGWTLVSAALPGHGGGHGRLQLQREDTGRQVLEIEPDRALLVRVHDAQGAPLAGLPVVLRALRGTNWEDVVLAYSRPEDGIAFLPNVLAAVRESRGARLVVALPLLGRTPVQAELDLAALPDEPIGLEWPASGSLLLHVERPGGALVSEPVSFTVSRARSQQDGDVASSSWTLAAPQGELAVAGIELGLELRIRAWGPTVGSATKSVSGPRTPGEVVDVRVATTTRGTTLAGRALAEDGTPLALADVRARIELERDGDPMVSSAQRLTTDREGRFRFPVQRTKPASATRTRLVLALDVNGAVREGSIPVDLAAVPDEADVGDVVLTADPLLAAGRVVDLLGQGIAGARVTLHMLSESDDEDEADRLRMHFRGGNEFVALTDHSGAFEARGRSNVALLALSAFHADYAGSDVVEVARGSPEVVLVLSASGTIAGRLLLDESIPFHAVQLRPLDARGEGAESHLDLEPDGRFELEGLRPGSYSIVASVPGEPVELARVDGILAEPLRTTEDPALDPLDLRGKVRAITLTVQDSDGKRIRWVQHERRVSGEEAFNRQDWWSGNEALTLYTASRAIDVRLSAEGYRTQEIDGLEADATVTLTPGIPVELVFGPELLAFDREHSTSVMLTSTPDDQTWMDVEGDRVSSRIGATGRHRISFFVEREGDWVEFGSELGLAIEVSDSQEMQTFEITLSPAAIEDARRKLQG